MNRKMLLTVYCLAVAFLLTTPARVYTQTQWDQDSLNPVIRYWSGDNENPSYHRFALGPTVMFDENRKVYRMWFVSLSGFGSTLCISEALSLDGSRWYLSSSNPVLRPGPPGNFDSRSLLNPGFLHDGTGYKLYYSGSDGNVIQIGVATSSDGNIWSKHPSNPVLRVGPPQSWEDVWVRQPSVIFENGIYKMWYDGYDGTIQWSTRIGYATSGDGFIWTKHPSNPIISSGPPGSFDHSGVGEPSVAKIGQIYHMTYTGYDALGVGRLGYAYSTDGINWTKYQGNPVIQLGSPGAWNDDYVASGALLLSTLDGLFHAWYPGKNFLTGGWQIGHATSIPHSVIPAPHSTATAFSVNSYPNPFNPSTVIEYRLPRPSRISIRIFDILGQEVVKLFSGDQNAGTYTVYWNGKNSDNIDLGSGTYFARLEYHDQSREIRTATTKLLLMK